MSIKFACVTDYEKLYRSGYYAHGTGMASFDAGSLPQVLADRSRTHSSCLLDIGGGNGLLAEEIRKHGVHAFTIDAADRDEAGFASFNLANFIENDLDDLVRRVRHILGGEYLATCFDVAEHIDLEHLHKFIFALHRLVKSECILSVSTRPSSAANRYHASVLPIETWKQLFNIAGFDVDEHSQLQSMRESRFFSGHGSDILAVSHWQRLNPFRETHPSYQHYLTLTKNERSSVPLKMLAARFSDILDLQYRSTKRSEVSQADLPALVYNVNFVQDWSFLRSLMDAWPSGIVRVLIREDLIAEPFLHMMIGYLQRTGVVHEVVSTVSHAADFLDSWQSQMQGALLMTATEGLPSVTHQMASMVALEGRKRGLRTMCLQHGMHISNQYAPISEFSGVWDEDTAQYLRQHIDNQDIKICTTGSPKILDTILVGDRAILQNRLGAHTAQYKRRILIGLGLHWRIHEYNDSEILSWLLKIAANHPETLFIVRPHPEDVTAYGCPTLFNTNNIFILDEMLLFSLDISVARVLQAVDGVITTKSTLVIDAAAAGKPVVLLPVDSGKAPDALSFLPISLPIPLSGGIQTMNRSDWEAGALPDLLRGTQCIPLYARDEKWFLPSRHSISNIAAIGKKQTSPLLASDFVYHHNVLSAAIKHVNFDNHPLPSRAQVTSILNAFLDDASRLVITLAEKPAASPVTED